MAGGDDGEPTPAASYTLLHTGDITTLPTSIIDGKPSARKKGTSVSIGGVHSTHQIVLSNAFVTQSKPPVDRSACFPITTDGKRAFGGLSGGFQQGKGNEVTGQYVFVALGITGRRFRTGSS